MKLTASWFFSLVVVLRTRIFYIISYDKNSRADEAGQSCKKVIF